jgi:cytochrome P450 family 4
MNYKFTFPIFYPQTFYKLTKMFREERKAQRILNDFQRNLMDKRRDVLKLEAKNKNEEKSQRSILIDHIILNEELFTADEIRDHILTFVSGYETWGLSLAHAMLLLAINQEDQQKLYDEIKMRIEAGDDLESIEVVNEIEYLDLVQKEVFRMLPPVPMVLRETLEDFELEPGLVIPKNTNMILNFFALHRQPAIWGDDVNEFKPERFLPENSATRNPFAYLPFSSGQRICIAYKYSVISLKLAIVQLLMNFKFKTSMRMDDIRLKSFISLKLCSEHSIEIERRDCSKATNQAN